MDKLVDHLFIIEGQGKVKDFNGSYSDYKRQRKTPSIKVESTVSAPSPPPTENETPTEEKRKLSYAEKKEIENIENDIEKMQKRKKEIESLFLDSSLSGEKISELSKELGDIDKSVDEKENRWLELSEFL